MKRTVYSGSSQYAFSLCFFNTRRPMCRSTDPERICLNTFIASLWEAPCRGLLFTANISSPEIKTLIRDRLLVNLFSDVTSFETDSIRVNDAIQRASLVHGRTKNTSANSAVRKIRTDFDKKISRGRNNYNFHFIFEYLI